MRLSEQAEREIRDLSQSDALRRDMDVVARKGHNPFIKDGKVDVDAYVAFVCQFNEFINHQPKPFKQMMDKDMRL